MKKFMYFFLTPFIAILLVIVKEYDKEIRDFYFYAPTIVTIFLVFATFFNAYLSTISPYKTLQETKKRIWKELDSEALKLVNAFKGKYDLNINIMICKRRLLSFNNPSSAIFSRKLSIFPRVFKVIWGYGNIHVHSKLSFTIKQGSCGRAYREETFYRYDLESLKLNTNLQTFFNFNHVQNRLTKEVKMIASAPIIHRKNGADYQKIQILGVINVESRTDGAGVLINNSSSKKLISDFLFQLSDTYINKLI